MYFGRCLVRWWMASVVAIPVSALTALEQQDGHLTQVEVDKVACLVRHVRAEVSADDAVPGRVVLLVELFLDVRGDIL